MTIDEAIAHEREEAKNKMDEYENHYDKDSHYYPRQCKRCAEKHEQLAEWLEELKALRLLLDWAIECGFGLDSFPDEYEQYKHTLTDDMNYTEMVKKIAKCVVEEQLKAGV